MEHRSNVFERQQFLPYLNDSIIQQAVTGIPGGYDWFDSHIPLLRYRGESMAIKYGLLEHAHVAALSSIKLSGYSGQVRSWDGSFDSVSKAGGQVAPFDAKVAREFEAYVQDAVAHSVQVILVSPPEYQAMTTLWINRDQVFTFYRRVAETHGLHLIDYAHHPICRDQSLFYNSQHMNKRGAELFSKDLAEKLRPILAGKAGSVRPPPQAPTSAK
jgi:hypothetical protein